jgi:NADH-quinone oxidoreductase subunit E
MKQEGLDTILQDRENDSSQLIEVLLDIQEKFRYLPEDMLREVSVRMKVPLIEVYRVANFYKAFSLNPQGRHLLTVCNGTACHVKGSPKLVDEAQTLLGLNPGETSADGEFTLETVNCVGACALSPVAILDGQYYEHVTPSRLRAILESVRKKQEAKA